MVFCYISNCFTNSLFITPDSSSDFTIFIISSFEIVIPDPQIFYWTAISAADNPDDNPNGGKTLVANVSTLFINANKLSKMA